ncbi:S41 family peptidase [Pseudoduganella aquatica]|uniref:Tail specific protease domain-containing protein n=1 Tax=Pseudoduganella aquatica TaxID=2660641 RepID=A0A7X4KKE0_9BURK|nr:S41 family peptidase [Pseudoduganella aquatica]MYN07029.1 hypothetical protein [Pseudoduganella aquatica]
MKQLPRLLSSTLLALSGLQAVQHAGAAELLAAAGAASAWQYLDAGKPAAPDWNSASADMAAAGWKTGAAPLGYGRTDSANTTVSFGAAPEAKPITTYFRRTVNVADPAQVALLTLDLRRDDGAVVYWNGVEIQRSNMPPGPVGARTTALKAIDGYGEIEYRRHLAPAAALPIRKGANVLAVEIHQSGPTSSDIVFDLEVRAYAPGETPPADLYPDTYAALAEGNADKALNLLLRLDPARAGYAQLAMAGASALLAGGGSARDPRYVRLLDRTRAAAPDDMAVVHAWIRARVAARKDLPIRPAPRPLPAAIAEQWRFIADTPERTGGPMLRRADLLADVDDLELILENCYSYLERRGADYRGALDALRASITTDLNADTFAHRVGRVLSVFGDPHSRVQRISEPRAAVRFVMDGERVAALKYDRSALLDPAHPYVAAINGLPVARWLAAAEAVVEQASPQYRRVLALEQLRRLGMVARQLQQPGGAFELTLASSDGTEARLPVALERSNPPAPPQWPAGESALRADNLGYLRLASMEHGPAMVKQIDGWMEKFSGTHGLIVDVRGNGGGTVDAIQTLLPWLMKPGDPMKIINVAAYRMPLALPEPNRGGFLGMEGRGLYPAGSPVWTAEEAQQVRAFLAGWQPAWQPPAGKFSDWHVMAVRPGDGAHGVYGKPVIVLLDESSFSATDTFLGALKGHPNVTLMGMASGGGSGRMADYTLPHSRLQMQLCQMASFTSTGQLYDGKGVQPDVAMPARLSDQLSGGGDSVLDAAAARLLKTTLR